jgi:hypothetical protein
MAPVPAELALGEHGGGGRDRRLLGSWASCHAAAPDLVVRRRHLLRHLAVGLIAAGCAPRLPAAATPAASVSPFSDSDGHPLLLVSGSAGRSVFVVHPIGGVQAQIEVGQAPWGVALAAGPGAFVATAEGVAVVNMVSLQRVALIPYQAQVGAPRMGEYRPGGMGIAASPGGRFAFVGVYLASGPSQLEVIDTEQGVVVGAVPIGVRPFQILAASDRGAVYSVDHDSLTLSVVDTSTLATRTLPLAPLGRAAFDKPHYAVLRPDGHLLLPFQGRVLLELDPLTGTSSTRPLTSNTHQHGAALTADGGQLLVVGTGPAGSATGPAALTQLDLSTGAEKHLPLRRSHERVAVSADGRWAYLTGGYTFADAGWDGLTVVDLWQQTIAAEVAVPERPLDIVALPRAAQA